MNKIACTAASFLLISSYAQATTTLPLTELVSQDQLLDITSSLVKSAAPSGTSVSNVSVSGSATFDDNRYLMNVMIAPLKFKVKYLFITDNAVINISFTTPNGDCNNPQITHIDNSGSNSLIDGEIKKYLDKNAVQVTKNFIIAKSNLVNYCLVKPTRFADEIDPSANENRSDVEVVGNVEIY